MIGGSWTKRDNFSVDRHQELWDMAVAGSILVPSGDGSEVQNHPGGRTFNGPRKVLVPQWVIVKVTGKQGKKTTYNSLTGQNSTANVNLGGGWYTGTLQVVKGDARDPSVDLSLSNWMQDSVADTNEVYVMYVPEDGTSSHSLSTTGKLRLLGQRDGISGGTAVDPKPVVRCGAYVGRPVFKITGTSTKPGTYTANPMMPPTAVVDPTSSSALAETDFGVADTSVTVYLINIVEKGAPSGHTQAAGTIIPGDFRGFAADGKPVFEIEAC